MRALLVLVLALAAACQSNSQAEPGAQSGPAAVPVTVASVAVRPVERSVSVVGTLAANAQVEVASEIEGQVTAMLADLGDRVQGGQTLARVQRDQVEARLREAEASLDKAVADEGRARPLRDQGIIAVQEYEQVRTTAEVARARRDQLRIQLAHADIRSPFDGSVAARLLDAGSYVRVGTVVYRVVQDDPLKFRGEVPEREAPALVAGQEVRITVEAFPAETFIGHVTRIGSAADPTARSLAFEAEVANPDRRLRPGFFAHGDVVVARNDRAVAVPRTALSSFAGVTKLFVIEDNVAREHAVTIGVDLGDGWVEIAHGVAQGKQVATSGLSKLADGTAVTIRTDVAPGA